MDRRQAARFMEILLQVAPRDRLLFTQVKAISTRDGEPPVVRSFPATALEKALDFADAADRANRNVYVSINPRVRWGGKLVDVEAVVALPNDFDDMELARAGADKLVSIGLIPGVGVRSGRGAHLYILLDRYEQRLEEAQAIGRRICRSTASDPVHARNQVMRLPGTRNCKRQVAGKMAELRICEPGRRYSLEEITARLDAANVPIPDAKTRGPRATTPAAAFALQAHGHLVLRREDLPVEEAERQARLLEFLPERYQRLSEAGVPRGERSEAVFGLIRVLTNMGASEDEIATFLRLRPQGIGELVIEKGPRWLEYTFGKVLHDPGPTAVESAVVSTIRLTNVWRSPRFFRAELFLSVEDGPFEGEGFKGGIDLGNPRAREPWRFVFLSCGRTPRHSVIWPACGRSLGPSAGRSSGTTAWG